MWDQRTVCWKLCKIHMCWSREEAQGEVSDNTTSGVSGVGSVVWGHTNLKIEDADTHIALIAAYSRNR